MLHSQQHSYKLATKQLLVHSLTVSWSLLELEKSETSRGEIYQMKFHVFFNLKSRGYWDLIKWSHCCTIRSAKHHHAMISTSPPLLCVLHADTSILAHCPMILAGRHSTAHSSWPCVSAPEASWSTTGASVFGNLPGLILMHMQCHFLKYIASIQTPHQSSYLLKAPAEKQKQWEALGKCVPLVTWKVCTPCATYYKMIEYTQDNVNMQFKSPFMQIPV